MSTLKLDRNCAALRAAIRGTLTLAVSGLVSLSPSALAGTIGYVVLGAPGNVTPESAIISAGHSPQALGTLAGANLAGINALWILNPSNGAYDADYTNNQAAINNFVAGGGRLLVHDRFVAGAAAVIPGAAGVTFVRDFDDGAEIQTTAAAPKLLNGPGGVITDANLDGGNYSNHGYALAATLPNGSVITLTQSDPTHAVDFHYSLNGGAVYYSTIPLDYYLNGNAPLAFSQVYAVNLAAYIFNLTGGAQAVPTPVQHVQLPIYWDANKRIGNMRSRLDNIRGAGRDRVVAQQVPLKLASAGPVTLGSPEQPSKNGIFVEVAGSESYQASHRNLAGYHSDTVSATVGYETALSQDLSVGISLGYDDTKTNTSRVRGNSNAELFSVSFFGRKYLSDLNTASTKDIYVDGVLGIRGGDVDISRSAGIRGSTDALQGYLSATLGADFVVDRALTVTPYVGTQYVHTTLSSFKEKGAGALTYGSQETTQWEALLGVRATRAFAFGNVDMVGSASVELHHALDQRNPGISTGLAGIAGTTSRIATHDLPKTYASARLGVEFSTRKNVAGYVDVSGFSSDSGSANGYSVGAGIRFSF